jgi:hypothetical protein
MNREHSQNLSPLKKNSENISFYLKKLTISPPLMGNKKALQNNDNKRSLKHSKTLAVKNHRKLDSANKPSFNSKKITEALNKTDSFKIKFENFADINNTKAKPSFKDISDFIQFNNNNNNNNKKAAKISKSILYSANLGKLLIPQSI